VFLAHNLLIASSDNWMFHLAIVVPKKTNFRNATYFVVLTKDKSHVDWTPAITYVPACRWRDSAVKTDHVTSYIEEVRTLFASLEFKHCTLVAS